VVVLREVGGERTLPIWIGTNEANAIAMELQGMKPERPMTHDLLRHLISGLGGELRRVQITDLREDTYYAELLIVRGEEVVQVDARPSDSIALALRCNAPIFTTDALLDRPAAPASAPDQTADPDALRRYLEKLDPQDFGRFQP
jgi:bifunctional DNase/RNase